MGIRRLAVLFEKSLLRPPKFKAWVLSWISVGCLATGVNAFVQQATAQANIISSSDLAKENLDQVSASEVQITAVLNANPGLFVELKRWVAKDAADRGQILRNSDLTDSAIITRLANDAAFRAAATRLLQGYGYLLPKFNPDSELGREQAALEQERIRERVAAQQANGRNDDQSEFAKCDASSNHPDLNCQGKQKQPAKAIQTTTANPAELPKDRDFDQLLSSPLSQPVSGNGSLLKTSAGPLGVTTAGAQAGNTGDLALLPISYERNVLPDPDPQLLEVEVENVENTDRRNYRVSFDKIHTRLGFTCQRALEDGIIEMADMLRTSAIDNFAAEIYDNRATVKVYAQTPDAKRSSIRLLETLARTT
jgi:hypothetical protein